MFKKLFNKQFAKYVSVGLLSTALDFGLLYLLVEFGHLFYLLAAICSMAIVLWVSFSLNKFWTFENFEKKYFQQFSKYLVSHLLALMVALIILSTLVQFFHLWYLFAKVFATIGAAIINFLLIQKFIFAAKDPSLSLFKLN